MTQMAAAIPSGYDPVLLNHWLWYKYRCAECSPSEFQVLFENILKRMDPKFMAVRAYGNIGDRKCDGLLFAEDGATTIFQVYAPDELKQAELICKIHEDLTGAVLWWRDSLKTWVFVYNVRRGVPPDVAQLLIDKRAEHPNILLDHWSSDALWEKIRALPLQKRAEILGAPTGYDHLFFSANTTDEEIRQHLDNGSFVLIQDLLVPISLKAVSEALTPAAPFGAPVFIRPAYGDLPWTGAAEQQKDKIREVLEKGRELLPHYSVFSIAPIPLAIHLGFLLSDRLKVDCFQYDREQSTWRWPTGKRSKADTKLKITDLPTKPIDGPCELAISIGLSAPIAECDVQEAAPDAACHISITVAEPDVMWLRSPQQLEALSRTMRRVLAAIRTHVRMCTSIHLFYAGPTGGAVVLGQNINPRMNPPVHLYEYSRQTSPHYRKALTLTTQLSL